MFGFKLYQIHSLENEEELVEGLILGDPGLTPQPLAGRGGSTSALPALMDTD